jgi:hypothetical protein
LDQGVGLHCASALQIAGYSTACLRARLSKHLYGNELATEPRPSGSGFLGFFHSPLRARLGKWSYGQEIITKPRPLGSGVLVVSPLLRTEGSTIYKMETRVPLARLVAVVLPQTGNAFSVTAGSMQPATQGISIPTTPTASAGLYIQSSGNELSTHSEINAASRIDPPMFWSTTAITPVYTPLNEQSVPSLGLLNSITATPVAAQPSIKRANGLLGAPQNPGLSLATVDQDARPRAASYLSSTNPVLPTAQTIVATPAQHEIATSRLRGTEVIRPTVPFPPSVFAAFAPVVRTTTQVHLPEGSPTYTGGVVGVANVRMREQAFLRGGNPQAAEHEWTAGTMTSILPRPVSGRTSAEPTATQVIPFMPGALARPLSVRGTRMRYLFSTLQVPRSAGGWPLESFEFPCAGVQLVPVNGASKGTGANHAWTTGRLGLLIVLSESPLETLPVARVRRGTTRILR